jgi:hypothetical protein
MATTMTERPPRRSGLVGPILLIGLGLILLLNNLGVLGWGIWDVFVRLWPVVLIAIGLDILLGRRSPLISLLVGLMLIAVFGVAIALSGMWLPGAAALSSTTIAEPLDGAQRANVELQVGVGTLRLSAMNEPDGLIAGSVQVGPNERVTRSFAVNDGTATYALRYENSRFFTWTQRSGDNNLWTLRLNPDVPLRLRIDSGVGTTEADLTKLRLTALEIHSGVGQTIATLPAQGDLPVTIEGGVGRTVLAIPQGVAARITVNQGLGNVQVIGNYQRQENRYISPSYDTATNRVDVQVDSGVGSIVIREQ